MQPSKHFTYYYKEKATFIRNHTNGTQYWYSVYDPNKAKVVEIPLTIGNINYYLNNIKQCH